MRQEKENIASKPWKDSGIHLSLPQMQFHMLAVQTMRNI